MSLTMLPIAPVLLPPGWRIVYAGDEPGDVYTVPAVALVACERVELAGGEELRSIEWKLAELDDDTASLVLSAGFGVLPPGVLTPDGVEDNCGVDTTLLAIQHRLAPSAG